MNIVTAVIYKHVITPRNHAVVLYISHCACTVELDGKNANAIVCLDVIL